VDGSPPRRGLYLTGFFPPDVIAKRAAGVAAVLAGEGHRVTVITRWPAHLAGRPYTAEELATICLRSSRILKISADEAAALEIACRSRGTPRITNRLLRRIRDFADVRGDGRITHTLAREALVRLDVDEKGFDQMDRKILETLIDKFSGGPVGVETLSSAISEDKDTIEDVYEPYLIQCGYLHRTPRGRVATRLAYQHLGRPLPLSSQQDLTFS